MMMVMVMVMLLLLMMIIIIMYIIVCTHTHIYICIYVHICLLSYCMSIVCHIVYVHTYMLVGLARVYHMTLQAGTGAVHHRTGQEALLLGIATPRNPEKLKFGAQQTATSS